MQQQCEYPFSKPQRLRSGIYPSEGRFGGESDHFVKNIPKLRLITTPSDVEEFDSVRIRCDYEEDPFRYALFIFLELLLPCVFVFLVAGWLIYG